MRLLLVEDDAAQRRTLCGLLRREAFDVVDCANLSESVNLLNSEQFAICVLDLRLDDQHGIDLLRQLNASQIERTHFIIHTGYGTFDAARDALNLGAFAFVEKLGDPSELINQVHRAAAQHMRQSLSRAEKEIRLQMRLLDCVQQAVIATDLAGTVMYWNKFAESLYGWTADEAVGRNVLDLVVVENMRDQADEIMQNLRNSKMWRGEFIARHRRGRRFPIEVTDSPIFDADNNLVGIIGVSSDITERKQAEEALRHSESMHREAQRIAGVGHWELDVATNTFEWSEGMFHIFGLDPQGVVPSPEDLSAWSEPQQRDEIQQTLRKAIETGEPNEHERSYRLAGGRSVRLISWGIPRRNAEGRVHRILGTVLDVTQRRRTEDAIRGMAEIASDVKAQFDNKMERLLGLGCELFGMELGIVGQVDDGQYRVDYSVVPPDVEIKPGTRMGMENTYCKMTLEANSPVVLARANQIELANSPQCEQFYFEAYLGTPIFIRGDPVGTVSFMSRTARATAFSNEEKDFVQLMARWIGLEWTQIKNVAAREKLIAELSRKNTELERFTYTVSHDLKSPLVTINGFLAHLKTDALNGNVTQIDEDIAEISAATHKMRRLLDELLEMSRIGRVMTPPSAVSLTQVAREAAKLVVGRYDQRNVAITIADNLPIVQGDPTRLHQVVLNLLDNALKFSSGQPNPTVEIGVRQDRDQQVCFVRDNGPGIDAGKQERIFELFEKLDPSSEGTGIGLSIVQRIIEVHRGQVWAEPSGNDGGTTICFTIGEPSGTSRAYRDSH